MMAQTSVCTTRPICIISSIESNPHNSGGTYVSIAEDNATTQRRCLRFSTMGAVS